MTGTDVNPYSLTTTEDIHTAAADLNRTTHTRTHTPQQDGNKNDTSAIRRRRTYAARSSIGSADGDTDADTDSGNIGETVRFHGDDERRLDRMVVRMGTEFLRVGWAKVAAADAQAGLRGLLCG